jgi:hypothetical protein
MNIVNTVAPIPMEDLKKFFIDKDVRYIIDYNNSSLKDKKLLIYLSNLEIPADINFSNCKEEEFKIMFDSYIRLENICNVFSLEKLMIEVIKQRKKLISNESLEKLIQGNEEVIDSWISKLDSLTIYNMYIIDNEEFKSYAESYPHDETDSLLGINFVNLLKHINFYDTYNHIDENNIKFYTKYFNEYIFKGSNLYTYWANENNIMFILTYSISSGILDASKYIEAQEKDFNDLRNASFI